MPLSKNDLSNGGIYLEKKGTLADRIDFAWEFYINRSRTQKERKEALKFLIFVFDIDIIKIKDVNAQLIALMEEREEHKATNPGFIPGKAPLHLPFAFDNSNIVPQNKKGEMDESITANELLDVNFKSRQEDNEESTIYLKPEERAEHRVIISRGLFQQNGRPFDT
jgi:hypothetical protein